AVPETRTSELKAKRAADATERGAAKYRLVDEFPGGPIAESFRNLRASLSLLGRAADRKVFLFTSALPNEGKSFTSVNYSLALAQQGHRVLLVDGDLRRPNIHKVFRNNNERRGEHPGLVDYLIGAVELKNASRLVAKVKRDPAAPAASRLSQVPPGELFIMAGGQRAPNPAELLSGECFEHLISEASSMFDRVVIDSAPILAVSDTLLMAKHVQTICMVVRANKTPRNAVHRALMLLTTAGNRPAGLVLNRLPRRRGAGYYYYYASHGYGDGQGSYIGEYARRAKLMSDVSSNGARNGAG
ncbi:MAG TPA: CpsD/CapB family tyrosine-protein kinase, partial [Chthoniobacterales bacterium]|nr:CpsD/CapB family tyrosine-protein kinase [Chthoniobacterales bacterium]